MFNSVLAMLALAGVTIVQQAAGATPPPREWFTAPVAGPILPGASESAPAIFRSTLIEMPMAPPQDSPDIAVTTATNTTQSENSVFVSPLNPQLLINSNNSSDWPVTQIYGADAWVSTDGGLTWTGSILGPGGANRGDPTTAIDGNGRMFVGYIGLDWGQGVSFSDNNGASWTRATVAPGTGSSLTILDKGHMWVDNSPTSASAGNLYAAWTNFQGGANTNQIEVRRSTDGGPTWSASLNVSSAVLAGSHNQGVNIKTGPNGEVYLVWAIYDAWPTDETALGFAKSTNGGQSYAPATRIITNIRGHRNTGLGGTKSMRHNSFPAMAVNQQTGEIYVVWTNVGVPGVNTGDPDIYMISSADGGATWSAPRRVNQDPAGNGLDQWFPWIACDPVTGTLACIFYDSRNSPTNDMAETFVAVSTDNGATWQDFRVSDFAWSGDAIPGFSGLYAGDYLAIDGRNNVFYPMWSDNRAGNMLVYASPFNVTGAPIAQFTGSPSSGCSPLPVNFTDQSSGTVTSWAWDFGDGNTSTLQHPGHTYANPGSYTVTLTATGPAGADTNTKPNYIVVSTTPVADFNASAVSGCAPLSVLFTDLSANGPTSWSWNFGDGGTSTVKNPAYTYMAAGTYTVTLTASNSCGSGVLTKTDYVTVTPPCGVKAFAQSDVTVTGTVTGSFANTAASDNVYESILEALSGGKPANRFSLLDHRWTFSVPPGALISFFVEAYRPDNADGDDFAFDYSTDNLAFTPLTIVDSPVEQTYSAPLPSTVSGTVYIRVRDTDRSPGRVALDRIFVDTMYIESAGTPAPGTLFVNSITVSRQTGGGNRAQGQAVVVIHDLNGAPAAGATVTGHFSGPTAENRTGTTTASGSVTLLSTRVKNPAGVWCFTVDNVARGSDFYDPARNVVTTACEGAAAPAVITTAADLMDGARLSQPSPNPFSASTVIRFRLEAAAPVSLRVFDVTGRSVATLFDGMLDAGDHGYTFHAGGLPEGIYFYRFVSGRHAEVGKMLLLK